MTYQKKLRPRVLRFALVGITIVLIQGSGGSDETSAPIRRLSHSPIASTESNDQASRTRVAATYGKLPLSFEENQGQVDGKVKFLSRGSGYTLFLTPTEAVLALSAQSSNPKDLKGARREQPPTTKSSVLRMKLVGANPSPQVAGLEELPGKSNYFIGSDSSKWRTNLATYAKVKYREVYPGIDLVYYGNQRQLEYDWIVSPGAETEAIRFAIEGAKRIKLDSKGDLVLAIAGGDVRLHKPVVYQETDGVRHEVAGSYVKRTNQELGFRLAEYDPAKPLVIDPVLVYSTYLGGRGQEGESFTREAIAVDSLGNAYVIGNTKSTDFPTANPLQPAFPGSHYAAFVTKFHPTGSALVYSTYLGGSAGEDGSGIAVDSSGNAYVTGSTSSTNFPTVNPLQPANAGAGDAFVTKINPTGSALIYSTYHGGSSVDMGNGIAVDSLGNAYVTGETFSTDFPTANPFQPSSLGLPDAFVTKFNLSGSLLVYSTFLGGGFREEGKGIAVDSSGNAYVTGSTSSTNFPTVNPLQADNAGGPGGDDAFVTKINPSGSALIYSTYHGGSSYDSGNGIAVDTLGNAYVMGQTDSNNLPLANPFQSVPGGGRDVFITKIGDPPPILKITMSKANYVGGETVTASDFRPQNPSSSRVGVRLKVWLSVPGIGEVTLVDITFFISANLDQNIGPVSLFVVTPGFHPKGNWQLNSRMENPTTGALLSQDINPFVIQ